MEKPREHETSELANCIIPADILMLILLRLPVKSLLRFKCVSRSWYAFITSSGFISNHYNRNLCHYNGSILIKHCVPFANRYKHVLTLVSDHRSTNIDLPISTDDIGQHEYSLHILGPLYGIVCIYLGSGDVTLWNPATREAKNMPPLTVSNRLSMPVVGFGLDSNETNDFKVVRFVLINSSQHQHQNEDSWVVEVYSHVMDSWREIAHSLSSDLLIGIDDLSIFLHGACHWYAVFSDHSRAILSFHMGNEVFQSILVPPALMIQHDDDRLVVVNERIAFISKVKGERLQIYYDISVMMDYGVEDSWINLCRIEVTPLSREYTPLGFVKNYEQRELLLRNINGHLALHDLDTHETYGLKVHKILSMVEFVFYVETLASIKGAHALNSHVPNAQI